MYQESIANQNENHKSVIGKHTFIWFVNQFACSMILCKMIFPCLLMFLNLNEKECNKHVSVFE